jgi:Mrp family chromosome partitioning ATPase
MSHLYAALQRAFPDGGLRTSVIDLRGDVVHEPVDFREESPARQSPHDRDRGSGLGRRSGPDDASRVPPVVANQLANLAQLLYAHPAKPRTIAFVASGRKEGTTTCLAHVGGYLARQQSSVLMVDANLPAPSLHSMTGVSAGPGLLDVMSGDVEVKDAIRATAVRNLFVLTSGERHSAGTNRLLLPPALRERLLVPTAGYDFVLVDCPALGEHEDAAVTAATCDATLLVVEGGRTLREQALASKSRLTRAHCTILGVFMNKRKFYIPKFVYDRL